MWLSTQRHRVEFQQLREGNQEAAAKDRKGIWWRIRKKNQDGVPTGKPTETTVSKRGEGSGALNTLKTELEDSCSAGFSDS